MRGVGLFLGIVTASLGVAVAAAVAPDWSWMFPIAGETPVGDPDDHTAYRVLGSSRSFSDVELHDLKHAVDWFPAEHPPLPGIVAAGHDQANACAFCHLPNGNGRPENSALAGLPADYIVRQIAAFANGARRAALAGAVPVKTMAATARQITPAEARQAADYFSRLRYVSHVRVVETAEAGFRPARFVYMLAPGPRQAIGERIIEVPVDPQSFARHDPHVGYVAFVPPGAVAAGGAVAASGGPAGQPCATCHGAGLRGGIAPPLAGRSPTGIVRQLAAFRVGARANPEAAPMRAVAAHLDDRMMIAVAAYAATLKP